MLLLCNLSTFIVKHVYTKLSLFKYMYKIKGFKRSLRKKCFYSYAKSNFNQTVERLDADLLTLCQTRFFFLLSLSTSKPIAIPD